MASVCRFLTQTSVYRTMSAAHITLAVGSRIYFLFILFCFIFNIDIQLCYEPYCAMNKNSYLSLFFYFYFLCFLGVFKKNKIVIRFKNYFYYSF